MKEFGINDYDQRTIVQLTEFVYRYATSILEEARTYANNSKKKVLDVDDVKLALTLATESSFVAPPPRDLILKCSHVKNYAALPLIKPHCGLRLPPDRYCLTACNYAMKSSQKKKAYGGGAMNVAAKMGQALKGPTLVKRTPTVALPKVLTKVAVAAKGTLKPRIQITGHVGPNGGAQDRAIAMDIDAVTQKRKRDHDDV